MSNEERSNLEGKTEENQSDEDKVRIAQLSNLEGHLSLGREEIADSRMVLRNSILSPPLKILEDAVQRIIRAQETIDGAHQDSTNHRSTTATTPSTEFPS